jgi:hypothetical protein
VAQKAGRSSTARPIPGRPDETPTERLDRNWDDILQELRVTQTGTQILLGFLLTIPFQQRFTELNSQQVTIYLVLVGMAAIATILALTPVALHRALFNTGAKPQLVPLAGLIVRLTLAAVAVTLSGTVLLIFDVVLGLPIGIAVGVAAAVLTFAAWALLPTLIRRARAEREAN